MCRSSGKDRPGQIVKAQISFFICAGVEQTGLDPDPTALSEVQEEWNRHGWANSEGPDQSALSYVQEEWNRKAWANSEGPDQSVLSHVQEEWNRQA